MRDDNHSRNYPPNDPYRRPPADAGNAQGGDPLAELARLIGQNDPFSDFAREQGHAPAPAHHPRRAEPMPSDWQARPAPQYAQSAPPAHDARHGTPGEQRDYAEPYREGPAADGQYAPQDYAEPGQRPAGQDYDPQQYADPRHDSAHGHQHGYLPQNSFPPARDQQGYGSDPYYRGMPHDEDMYEDRAPARRRGGLLTVMAVLALAVVGTAVAFGYRAVFSNSGSALTPPTIKADAGSNKVVPAAQSGDAAAGKLIYDRVGDKSQPERVVSREEQPVDLKNAAPPPRVVLSSGMSNPIAPMPNSPVPASAPAFAAPSAQPAAPLAAATAANASTEPKKVRTLTIRPDQPVAAPETAGAPSAPVSAPARQAVAVDQPAPVSTTVRTTTIRPQQTAQGDPNAPLSLTPNNSAQRVGTMRTASAPAARPVATNSGDSAYAVQVTSQRSEADAQSSFQALQAKYPNVLGNRQAMIRRADLGDKGTYYRAQVPFGSQGEASEFCASLKAAGGQCVVQRN